MSKKYIKLRTTEKNRSKKSRRKSGPGREKKIWVKILRYIYSDRAAKPARRCQLK